MGKYRVVKYAEKQCEKLAKISQQHLNSTKNMTFTQSLSGLKNRVPRLTVGMPTIVHEHGTRTGWSEGFILNRPPMHGFSGLTKLAHFQVVTKINQWKYRIPD